MSSNALEICVGCESERPMWDMYETTESHPRGEGWFVCPACASEYIRDHGVGGMTFGFEVVVGHE